MGSTKDISTISSREGVLRALADEITIPDSYDEKARGRAQSIGEWLDRPGSTIKRYRPEIFPQGSFALGTVIKPVGDGDAYDVDLVCRLAGASRRDFTQAQLKTTVGAEILAYARAQNMNSTPQDARRCWTMDYADEASFHIDILPCVPDLESDFMSNVIVADPRHFTQGVDFLGEHAVAITDKKHENYFRHGYEWPLSNPKGYVVWFRRRQQAVLQKSVLDAVRNHSGDAVDMKQYEPAMRYLIDTFIKADGSTKVSALEDMSLVDLVIAKGAQAEDSFPGRLRGKRNNAAEAIENNVRRLIIEETPINPRFYEKISRLLIDLVAQRKKDAISYADYLKRIAELARKVKTGHDDIYPDQVSSPGKKALYDNLDGDEDLALKVDSIIRETAQDGFRSSARKQRLIRNRLAEVLADEDEIDRILDIVMAQDEY